MTVAWANRPWRKPFSVRRKSVHKRPSTPTKRPAFKKSQLPTPEKTPTFKLPGINNSDPQGRYKPTQLDSPSTPNGPRTPSARKRAYVKSSDEDSDDEEFTNRPTFPSNLKVPKRIHTNHNQLTPSPSPSSSLFHDRIGPRRSFRIINPPAFSALYREQTAEASPRSSPGNDSTASARERRVFEELLEGLNNRQSLRTAAPSPSPPQHSVSHKRRRYGLNTIRNKNDTTTTGNSSCGFHTTPRRPIPSINISSPELTRTCELILKRTRWDEVALFVAANRPGIRYREAVRICLGWIAALMEEEDDDYDNEDADDLSDFEEVGGGDRDATSNMSGGSDDVHDDDGDGGDDGDCDEDEEEEDEEEANNNGDEDEDIMSEETESAEMTSLLDENGKAMEERIVPIIGGWIEDEEDEGPEPGPAKRAAAVEVAAVPTVPARKEAITEPRSTNDENDYDADEEVENAGKDEAGCKKETVKNDEKCVWHGFEG